MRALLLIVLAVNACTSSHPCQEDVDCGAGLVCRSLQCTTPPAASCAEFTADATQQCPAGTDVQCARTSNNSMVLCCPRTAPYYCPQNMQCFSSAAAAATACATDGGNAACAKCVGG